MKIYKIRFQKICDIENYLLFLKKFSFKGVVPTDMGYIDSSNILLILETYRNGEFDLISFESDNNTLMSINMFLQKTGLGKVEEE